MNLEEKYENISKPVALIESRHRSKFDILFKARGPRLVELSAFCLSVFLKIAVQSKNAIKTSFVLQTYRIELPGQI